jgi:hypothetical protein
MNANKQYKASVFSLLFSTPDTLRELYSAISGRPVSPDEEVKDQTLKDVLFMDRVNDLAFTIGDKLVILVEHQSSVNNNMALRLLIYIARIYEKIVADQNLYARSRIKIPRPEFYVLYNGEDPYPDKKIIKLSDSWDKVEGLANAMDLEVTVFNINEGRNPEMLKKSPQLGDYAEFVDTGRNLEQKGLNRAEALAEAVQKCIKKGVLADFLRTNGSEVVNMLLTEWNWDDDHRMALAEGREEGRVEGREEGRAEGREEGRAEGREEGRAEGREEGRTDGRMESKAEDVRNLSNYGMQPAAIASALKLPMEDVQYYLTAE